VPAGRYSFGPGFGITLIAPAWQDHALLTLGARYLGETPPASDPICHLISDKPFAPPPPPAVVAEITLAVCGAHLRGQPLHHQLTTLGARFVAATVTAPVYRLYALANTTPPKPGLVRAAPGEAGAAIAIETYSLSPDAFGRFTAAVPPPLAIGNVELNDGTWVKSFLCEPHALRGATDITSFGGWTAWLGA
jgi:allophanate hydrolase